MNRILLALFTLLPALLQAQEISREFKITGKYLNIPVNLSDDRQRDGDELNGIRVPRPDPARLLFDMEMF